MNSLWRMVVVLLLVLPLAAAGQDAEKDKKLPVEAKLVVRKDIARLMLDGKTPEEFRKLLKEGEATGKLPEAPAVGLVLELHNTSDKEVLVWIKGDPVVMDLELKGPGAVSVKAQQAFTQEFRIPGAVRLKPGMVYPFPIQHLKCGFRGVEKQVYWTEEGEYTLTATLKTAISPAPPGTKADKDGFGPVLLRSNTGKIRVLK